jgi:hypothetical protein
VRGAGWNTDPSAGDIRGGQINAIAGLTRKLTPDLLVGVLGGYENFDYTSQTLNGRLKGDGWTVTAFNSALGLAAHASAPTYKNLYSGDWAHPAT